MRILTIVSGALLASTLAGAALPGTCQDQSARLDGSNRHRLPDTTGRRRDVVISRGPLCVHHPDDSAAAGNAEKLTRRIPQGGGGRGR